MPTDIAQYPKRSRILFPLQRVAIPKIGVVTGIVVAVSRSRLQAEVRHEVRNAMSVQSISRI
ncbi:hypothetical protein K469DRAFT_716633 [Zopfia rhizophila CBS 207.26]|uniref:Uncharacterized protein n=1 Tax=Zopfia rhizophila CBS 207.26 TaxID=1314779 RepID=A0A6A6EN02_9PEZI|nr:hypothetical protein K469DRAFT_716633 [Zopfia rhizophila CBS 207.26]